jgi:parvulin-like peptidyl-prolyl isomerase
MARKQAFAPLAAQGGVIPPIYRGYPEAQIEKESFSLKPGEVSRLLTLPDGSRVILKCIRHIPAETGVKLEAEREKLQREVTEARLTQMVPQYFKALRDQAQPQIYMKRPVQVVDQIPPAANPAAPQQGAAVSPNTQPSGGIVTIGGQKK